METFNEMKETVDNRKRVEKEKHESSSSKRLCNIAQKKILTATIGALSSIEEHFGELWGHGQSEDLTPEQTHYKDIFEKARSEILDKGNNQSRNLKAEFLQYTIVWNRFSLTLPIKPMDNNPEDENV